MAVKGHRCLASTKHFGGLCLGKHGIDVIELPTRQLLLPGSESEWYFPSCHNCLSSAWSTWLMLQHPWTEPHIEVEDIAVEAEHITAETDHVLKIEAVNV